MWLLSFHGPKFESEKRYRQIAYCYWGLFFLRGRIRSKLSAKSQIRDHCIHIRIKQSTSFQKPKVNFAFIVQYLIGTISLLKTVA